MNADATNCSECGLMGNANLYTKPEIRTYTPHFGPKRALHYADADKVSGPQIVVDPHLLRVLVTARKIDLPM